MAERWATFDCYGTFVDWNGGIGAELGRLLGDEQREQLLARYHEVEPAIQAAEPGLRYRDVMARGLARLAEERGIDLPANEQDALARSLPDWPVFPEVPAALERARGEGFRLCILSNSDPDLIQASMERIGVPFDDAITASEIGSYKPDHGHWRAFADRHGNFPDVHVGASLFHDMAPANELGIPCVWVNRLDERAADVRPTREIATLEPLPAALAELAPA
ncbi:MAG TPA: HAD-IA family hydrolase [Gaiellaceae bacterium]|nr:HAD-IA family hydrolase [Gaiellaceae bacterium]